MDVCVQAKEVGAPLTYRSIPPTWKPPTTALTTEFWLRKRLPLPSGSS